MNLKVDAVKSRCDLVSIFLTCIKCDIIAVGSGIPDPTTIGPQSLLATTVGYTGSYQLIVPDHPRLPSVRTFPKQFFLP